MKNLHRNVVDPIFEQAVQRPAAPALIHRDQVLSFREMKIAINQIATTLLAAGVRQGHVVGVSMVQTPLHLMTLLALAQIGGVSVAVHALLPLQRRRLAAERFKAQWIVSGREEMRIDGLPFVNLGNVNSTIPEPATISLASISTDSPFRIALSSGTSGDPKGVLFTHGYMLDRMAKSNYACNPHSRMLTMDLNFAVGFMFAFGMLSAGGAMVFPASTRPADMVLAVRAHAVTHWLLSPAQAREISGLLVDEDIYFATIEHLRIVGATPDAGLMTILRRRFSANVFVPYGSTEMGPISIATPEILALHPESAGRLFPWARAEIVDDDDRPVPPNHRGRLRLQAEGMIEGYVGDPARSSESFRGGWYYPGDQARINQDGLLFVEGREDDVLTINGAKVLPDDVESILLEHPAVVEAAAFATEEISGRVQLAAAVIVSENLPTEELLQFAAERLGPLAPRRIVKMLHLPRNLNGKLLRNQLASEAAPLLAAASHPKLN